MVARLIRYHTFLFLLLAAFQQSCRTEPIAPAPHPAAEAEKAESTAQDQCADPVRINCN